jgi:DNA-binding NarL/FixJ family response regulator
MTPEEVIAKLERNEYGEKMITRSGFRKVAKERTPKESRELGIVSAYRAGKPTKQIAYDWSVASSTVYNIIRRHGIPLRNEK